MQSKAVAKTNIYTMITNLPATKKHQPGLALVTGIRAGYTMMVTDKTNGLGAGGLAVGGTGQAGEGVGAYEGEA